MKKYLGLLSCLFLLNSCDDGDLAFDSFDFDLVTPKSCKPNGIGSIFRIKENEALVLTIGQSDRGFPFRNQITGETPRIFDINNSNRIIYRVFNGEVGTDYFCSSIPPVDPNVIDEWITSPEAAGQIEISTKMNTGDFSTFTGVKYDHVVTFKNITFTNTDGSLTYTELPFGKYQTDSKISFSFVNPIQSCSNTGKLFKILDTNLGNIATEENVNGVLEFTITPAQLAALAQGPNSFLISDTNKVTYKIYDRDINNDFICSGTTISPVLYEQWNADNGVPTDGIIDATGEIKINKTTVAGVSRYDIVFTNLKFRSGETTFLMPLHNFGLYTN